MHINVIVQLSVNCFAKRPAQPFFWLHRNASLLIRFIVKPHLTETVLVGWSVFEQQKSFKLVLHWKKREILSEMEPSYYCRWCNTIYRPAVRSEYCFECHGLMTLLPGYVCSFVHRCVPSFHYFFSIYFQVYSSIWIFHFLLHRRWLSHQVRQFNVISAYQTSRKWICYEQDSDHNNHRSFCAFKRNEIFRCPTIKSSQACLFDPLCS